MIYILRYQYVQSLFYYVSLLICARNYFLFARVSRELSQDEIKLPSYIFSLTFRKHGNFGLGRGYIDGVINDNGQYISSIVKSRGSACIVEMVGLEVTASTRAVAAGLGRPY